MVHHMTLETSLIEYIRSSLGFCIDDNNRGNVFTSLSPNLSDLLTGFTDSVLGLEKYLEVRKFYFYQRYLFVIDNLSVSNRETKEWC